MTAAFWLLILMACCFAVATISFMRAAYHSWASGYWTGRADQALGKPVHPKLAAEMGAEELRKLNQSIRDSYK